MNEELDATPRIIATAGKARVSPALLRTIAAAQAISATPPGPMTTGRLRDIETQVARMVEGHGFNGPLFAWLGELIGEVKRVRGV